MPRVAAELPPESRSKKKSGTPISAAVPKQMSCRFVRLKATFDFTLVKSRGTEIYAANKAPPLMRSENRFRHGAGFEQTETEQDGVADNAPDRIDGIAGNRHILNHHGIDVHSDENENALKSQRKQAFQIVLSHVALFMVAPCCHGNRRKAHHTVDLNHASVHNDENHD